MLPSWASNDANLPDFFKDSNSRGIVSPLVCEDKPKTTAATPRLIEKKRKPKESSKSNTHLAILQEIWGPEYCSQVKMDSQTNLGASTLVVATAISETLLQLPGISPRSVITDGTAGTGRNTISFAMHFSQVQAIELDKTRCAMCAHNIGVCKKEISERTRVEIFQGDCLELISFLKQDIIFLDPQSCGEAAGKGGVLSNISLSGRSLPALSELCLNRAFYLALKLPKNCPQVDELMEVFQVVAHVPFSFETLLVITKKSRKNPETRTKMEDILLRLIRQKEFRSLVVKSHETLKN